MGSLGALNACREAGDWYARGMYLPGQRAYDHHLKTYGHPADTGFIDIYPQWRAENWNPDDLLDLYAKAGAKYFVAMANHHDNFDAYQSRFHDWNSVRLGPKKDIIGLWAKAARKRGLRFGVSNHSAHAWHWFQTAYGYDPEGPRKGERYDAFKRFAVDGKGKWWEGLDPQQLYGGAVMPLPDGFGTVADTDKWHEANDRVWTEKAPLNNPAFTRQWYLRCKDLIDSYKPDLVYFDNFDLPLEQAGLDIAAHYYNASLQWRGKLEAVINIKPHDAHRPGIVADVERGLRSEISAEPWQTDTCIGDWHYNRRIFEEKRYLPAAEVIHRLCDIVSKNGNLLLSIPVRGDGTIDSEERRIVEEIGAWMGTVLRGHPRHTPLDDLRRRADGRGRGHVQRRQAEAVHAPGHPLHEERRHAVCDHPGSADGRAGRGRQPRQGPRSRQTPRPTRDPGRRQDSPAVPPGPDRPSGNRARHRPSPLRRRSKDRGRLVATASFALARNVSEPGWRACGAVDRLP
jgi:alpha-L-fucosidase